MTETEKKALALVNETSPVERADLRACTRDQFREALCRAIEQHEAFRQEVSDAVTGFDEYGTEAAWERLSRFIIAKPDPLVEAMRDACGAQGMATKHTPVELTEHLRAALAARGLEIREKQP